MLISDYLKLVEKKRGRAGRDKVWAEVQRMAPYWGAT